jgi:trimethylamine--corrinoid protein Co-methyltransferase
MTAEVRERPLDKRRGGSKVRERRQPGVVPPGLEGGWYKPLRDEDVKRIHEASLEVLERTGIEVMPSECREIFRQAGARIDEERDRVFIPRAMVEDALASARNEVILCGRDPKHDLRLVGWRVHMGTGGAAVKVIDLNTGRIRKSRLADVAKIGKLVDALDNIHFYLRACVAQDIPEEWLDVNTYYAALTNTTKHVTGNCFTVKSAQDVIEMASMIVGGVERLRERPIVSFVSSWAVSPLRYAPETVEVLTELVRQEMPVFLSSAPQAGATSPAALAGTLVQINADRRSDWPLLQLTGVQLSRHYRFQDS